MTPQLQLQHSNAGQGNIRKDLPTTFLVLSGRCRPSSDWAMVSMAAWREAANSLTRELPSALLLFSTSTAASLYSSSCWLVIIFLLSLSASSFTGSVSQHNDSQTPGVFSTQISGKLEAGGLTLQNPVDLGVVGQPLQLHGDGRQVGPVLLQGLAAAAVQLDGPLW